MKELEKNIVKIINGEIKDKIVERGLDTSNISDTCHTFGELYDQRAKLFSVIVNTYNESAWKSKLHYDGDMFEGMFIVGVTTPKGDYTYHYNMDYWDIFNCKELETGNKWDGHTTKDIGRLNSLIKWEPAEDDIYWYIKSSGDVDYCYWGGLSWDYDRLAFDNCFRTKEVAEEKAKEIREVLRGV